MKRLKRILALVIAASMVMAAMSLSAFAEPVANTHTITITNTDQNVNHTYEVYQIFSGNLNADEDTLSDIAWGSGVNGAGLLAALKASRDPALLGDDPLTKDTTETDANIFTSCTTAQDVAKVLATLSSTATFTTSTKTLDGTTEKAGAIDAVATIIGGDPADTTNFPGYLTNVAASDSEGTPSAFTQSGTSYSATVYGDGYYFIKDTTATLKASDGTGSDTLAKYMLSVVRDETIVAKDTGITPDKEILDAVNGVATETKVSADSSAIGDTVTFDVEVTVPNTRKYEQHFWFVMNDKLPEGITFTGISSVKVGNMTLIDTSKASPAAPISDAAYTTEAAANGYYTLKVNNPAVAPSTEPVPNNYEWEVAGYDAVKAAGGQTIEIVFNQFKKFVETNNLIGQKVIVTYTGVVNDDASYEPTGNENEVTFDYSNNPNHDYNGDEPGPDDDNVTGTTPKDTTKTYTTSLKILKVDENGEELAGATFELKGNSLNRTVLTGYRFVETSYTPTNGEEVDTTATYWKLKDGSYTTTDPATVANTTQYQSTETKYYKVTYDYDEVTEKETDIVIVTDDDGVAEFTGLREGTDYTLEEIAAPDGYNKIDGISNITITWEDPEKVVVPEQEGDAKEAAENLIARGGFTIAEAGTTANPAFGIEWNDTNKQFEVTIKNQSGSVLPSTGGIGTTIFYIVGAILVIGAGVILITKRRMDA